MFHRPPEGRTRMTLHALIGLNDKVQVRVVCLYGAVGAGIALGGVKSLF